MVAQPLTRAQRTVARLVLATLAEDGFCLAGGAALAASGLSSRPTRDVDAFTDQPVEMGVAARKVVKALEAAGFEAQIDREFSTFASLNATAGELRRSRFKIDLAWDYREWPAVTTSLGPTLSVRELAANKMLALFARVEPRDLADIAALSEHLDVDDIFVDAKTKDPGFNRAVLAEMVHLVLQRTDERWPEGVDIAAVRSFGRQLLERLEVEAAD